MMIRDGVLRMSASSGQHVLVLLVEASIMAGTPNLKPLKRGTAPPAPADDAGSVEVLKDRGFRV